MAVAIAVAFAIAVAIAIVTVAVAHFEVVHHEPEVGQLAGFVNFVDEAELPLVGKAVTHHKEAAVNIRREAEGIAHEADGGRVDDDVIVIGLEVVEEVFGGFAQYEFGGVGWHNATRVHVQVGVAGQGRVHVGGVAEAEQYVGDAGIGAFQPEVFHDARPAQVEFEEGHFFVGEGKHGGEVYGNKGFAFAGHGACNQDGLKTFLVHEEAEVGAHDAELLGDDVAAVAGHHQALVVFHVANLAHNVGVGAFGDVVAYGYAVVEQVAEVDDANGQQQAEQDAEHADFFGIGLNGLQAGVCRVHAFIGGVGARGGDGDFFLALQEIHVEFFLHFLLPFELKLPPFFFGDAGQVAEVFAAAVLQVGALRLQYAAVIAEAFVEAAFNFFHLLVELHNGQAAGALLFFLFLFFEAQAVVFANEGADGRVFNAEGRGHDLGFFGGGVDVVFGEIHHPHLPVEFVDLLFGGHQPVGEYRGLLADGQEIVAVEKNVLVPFECQQFTAERIEAVFNEVDGAFGGHVFGFLAVHDVFFH